MGDQGTVLDKIPDYVTQLNGTAERNIQTVMDMIRSMLEVC